MSDFAAFRIAVVVALSALCWLAGPAEGKGESQRERATRSFEQRRLNNPRLYEPRCEAPEDREEADLCAQREMAVAARDLYEISWLQLVLSALGLGALGITLYFTRQAVIAAIEANKVSRDISTAEHRAYIQAEKVEIHWSRTGRPMVVVTVRNTGQTPARWHGYRCLARKSPQPSTPFDREAVEALPLTKWYGFAAGAELTFRVSDRAVVKTIEDAYYDSCNIRIDGVIEYETFFGEVFISEFSYFGKPKPQQAKIVNHELVEEPPTKLSRTTEVLRSYFRLEQPQD